MIRPATWALTLVAIFALLGCATPAPYQQMVPAALPADSSLKGTPIAIFPVSGGMETKSWDIPRIGNSEFQQALHETLLRAGAVIRADVEGSYSLDSKIISQNVTGSFSNTITLLVRYTLKNPKGRRIWSENILSEQELSVKDSFSGSERMKRLQTSAVQSNLSSLLQKLGQALRADQGKEIPAR